MNGPSYTSNLFSCIGSVFLGLHWPNVKQIQVDSNYNLYVDMALMRLRMA